ncbi:hypothetical protein JCM10213v2_000468 [Rhodosporidiobolus nylandii]
MLKLFQLATLAAIVLAAAVFARPALVYVPLKVTGLAAGSAFQTDPSAALEELLTAAVNDVNSTAPKCATQCVPWLEALQPCAATTTAQETAQCFCQTQTVGLMGTCATCLSLSQDSQGLLFLRWLGRRYRQRHSQQRRSQWRSYWGRRHFERRAAPARLRAFRLPALPDDCVKETLRRDCPP